MCIVCGSGAEHLLRAIVNRHAAQPRRASRLTARAVAPEVQPPLDPGATGQLDGPADVILRGGPILTMAGTPVAEAMAVRAGRIQAVGAAEIVMPHRGRLTRVIDLQGRAVLPGFVNAHWHMPFTLLCDWVDVDPSTDWRAALGRAVAAAQPGEWVVLRAESEGVAMTRPLDGIAPANPVAVVDADGIIEAANSLAVQNAPLPAHVSGLLNRFAARLALSTDAARHRLRRLLEQTAATGVTCLRVCGLGSLAGADDLDMMRDAVADAPRLRLRGTLDSALLAEWRDLQLAPGFGDDVFRVDTVSAWAGAESGGAQRLTDSLRSARQAGWRVTVHADGDAQVDSALETLAAGPACDRRDGIECRRLPSLALLARAAGLGVSLGVTSNEAEPVAPLSPPGLPLSLGLDASAGPSPPLAMLARAVAGGLSADRALAAITIDAARRCGAEAILGSLERGKYADLVFLNGDPRHMAASGLRCTATWLHGLDVFRA